MSSSVRWGIAGTGSIAATFVRAIGKVDEGRVTAVGSRTADAADRFADAFGIPRAHGSYEALVEDPNVDVVYIATPHARHFDTAALSLDAGKHVLCEKPMSLSARQSTRMAELAHAKGLFLMEALWSRFLPAYRTIESLVGNGAIGEVLCVEASFGFCAPIDPSHRLFALDLGGGALLDVGIYPVHLAHSVLGSPATVRAIGHIGTTGVDEQTVVTMQFPNGALAIAHAAIRTRLACTGRITGTEGVIEIPAIMHCPQYLNLVSFSNDERRRIDTPLGEAPFHFQIDEVHRCLDAGMTESRIMPLAESLAIATTLDLARSEIGLVYPGE